MSRESRLAAALAVAAALRVLAFSAAFPFFTNVDEHKHVDAVLKYARGYMPHPDSDRFEDTTGVWLGALGSPEYHLRPGAVAPPPPWRRPPAAMLDKIERDRAFLLARPNKEAYQPPVYYVVAGLWLRAGQALGLDGGPLLYWLRALNALGVLLLVGVAYRGLAALFPDDTLVKLGVPALLAVFPQDALYYVTRDALSPLLGATAFFLALRVAESPDARAGAYAAAGAATALACLAKYTHVALLGVCALASLRAWRARAPGRTGRLLCLWGVALAPIALWMLQNAILFGDPTATALKARRLGWDPNPPGAWLDHPLLSLSGIGSYLAGLVPKFWRGELVWHRTLLAWPPADWLYLVTSLGFVGLAALGLVRGDPPGTARRTRAAALLMLGLSVAALVALSFLYRFPELGNPSAARPWFDHGRLIGGALVPFLILYVRGVERATAPLPERMRGPAAWSVLAVVAAVALGSEIALSRPVFSSAYNGFHLP